MRISVVALPLSVSEHELFSCIIRVSVNKTPSTSQSVIMFGLRTCTDGAAK